MNVTEALEVIQSILGDAYLYKVNKKTIHFVKESDTFISVQYKHVNKTLTIASMFPIFDVYIENVNVELKKIRKKSQYYYNYFDTDSTETETKSIELISSTNKDIQTYKVSKKSTKESIELYVNLVLLEQL